MKFTDPSGWDEEPGAPSECANFNPPLYDWKPPLDKGPSDYFYFSDYYNRNNPWYIPANQMTMKENMQSQAYLNRPYSNYNYVRGGYWVHYPTETSISNDGSWVVSTKRPLFIKDSEIPGFGNQNAVAQNGGGNSIYGWDNAAREVVGAGLFAAGQPWLSTRGKFQGATKGTSIASKVFRNIEKPLPTPIKIPTGTLSQGFKMSRCLTWGEALGRITPWVGAGLLIWDGIDLSVNLVKAFINDDPAGWDWLDKQCQFPILDPKAPLFK